ncbi:RQC domain protein [Paenibacillus albidus]|uniref:RQC-minor-1 family DNA-binding protein n=1 Tax=Paenibacillus albidus TaxID=2041023 RepID=UPI001BE6E95D|nr:RQC-minor-1 family DNA-binding protein [Paenibacillus albidus]MBT2289372.1 RQC domain protein [Paenibacillus albidus]
MGRRSPKVKVQLDSGDIRSLTEQEIKAILRAAEELIMTGGRNLLAKILKGSKDKRILKHELQLSPVYGYYRDLKLEDIMHRIDWMILKGYLEIEYDDRLPMIVYSDKGWAIERETYAEELLLKLASLLDGPDYSYVETLKDRNRGMILLLIEKIKGTGNARFVPLLRTWQAIEYKKVQAELQSAMQYLLKEGQIK